MIFTPWVITVLLVIGPVRIVPYRLTFCDCISSPVPRLWKEVMSRLRITRLSARADRSGNWWPRRGAHASDVGSAAFSERECESFPKLPVFCFQLPVARGGDLQAPKQGEVGGSLAVGN
nr:hypothetical protein [Streptomyces brevispora]